MSGENDIIRLDLPVTYKYLNVLCECLRAMLERVEDSADIQTTTYNVQLAINEVFANIVGHAFTDATNERIQVAMTVCSAPSRVVIEFNDTGAPFDPSAVAPPDLDDIQVRGYGLFLVESLMDEVDYERGPDGNHWRLVKYL